MKYFLPQHYMLCIRKVTKLPRKMEEQNFSHNKKSWKCLQLTFWTLFDRAFSTNGFLTNTATIGSSVLVARAGVACHTLLGGLRWYAWVDHMTLILQGVRCPSELISDLLDVLPTTDAWSSYFAEQNPSVQKGHIDHVIKNMHRPSSAGCFDRIQSNHLVDDVHSDLRFIIK